MSDASRAADEPIRYSFDVPTGTKGGKITLYLTRIGKPRNQEEPAVLLLHGANTSSETFHYPQGGLVRFLKDRHWDVWLLDWRGSPLVTRGLLTRRALGGSAVEECKLFTYDEAAREDLPRAVAEVRKEIGKARLSVLGHCVGSGLASIAIALGKLESVENIVLTGPGLFYEAPWDGWAKVEDFILERVQARDPSLRAIDPRQPAGWPAEMASAYALWPSAWKIEGDSSGDELFRRVSFMIGQPWAPGRIDSSLDGVIGDIFGALHLGLYLNSGQNVRRGYAAPSTAPDVIDRPRIASRRTRGCGARALSLASEANIPGQDNYFIPEPFRTKRITLITGAQNRIWHRDCVDLMCEWLREIGGKLGTGQYVKHVLPDYGLQDLYWHPKARADVYPHILTGL
jgi:cholesterol oxidase